MTTITIDPAFNGPDRSGNGGYVAGLVASGLGGVPTTSTLRVPPPLGVPLEYEVDPDAGRAELRDGDAVVGTATVLEGGFDVPAPRFVEPPLARRSAEDYPGFAEHPFARCFTCGTAREAGDGLRIFTGPFPGEDGLVAGLWTVHPAFGDPVDAPVVWASIDCPGSWAADAGERAMVLGRMTGQVLGPVHSGTTYVVVGALRTTEGRKRLTGTALYTEDGTLVARSEQTWITVDVAAFR
ncbi:hypothetical protein CLV56_1159 [Mumia flava]|uniref:Thioesterase superfamily protein n=1 Tax=Mumia flava TaxID=1348852 RepID=A0A0B2BRQ2_9ACTN|nr:hypothetical protein [Mumia flava]PJJ56941.1 hypothetical protein CLV56_1159 [Mumia flava]